MKPRLISGCALILGYLILLLAASGCASSSPAPQQEQFSSPDAAAATFVAALRERDEARLKQILGPEGTGILSSMPCIDDDDNLTAAFRGRLWRAADGGGRLNRRQVDDETKAVLLLRREQESLGLG